MITSATILADSLGTGHGETRLTTMELVYPRRVHDDLMTYRRKSRNAASARAIPIQRIHAFVSEDPAPPLWRRNKGGMIGIDDLTDAERSFLDERWNRARKVILDIVQEIIDSGIDPEKEEVNRLMMPFQWYTSVVTAEEVSWRWMIHQRDNPQAGLYMQQLGRAVRVALENSIPTKRRLHIPGFLELDDERSLIRAVAFMARTSYMNHHKGHSYEADYELVKRLFLNEHWSPFEHVARFDIPHAGTGNFDHWIQLRYYVEEHGDLTLDEVVAAFMGHAA